MLLATVPAAPPTLKNQRTTSCPAPISAKVPYHRGSRLILSALEWVSIASCFTESEQKFTRSRAVAIATCLLNRSSLRIQLEQVCCRYSNRWSSKWSDQFNIIAAYGPTRLFLFSDRDGENLGGVRGWLLVWMWSEKRISGKHRLTRCDQNPGHSRTSGQGP